MELIHAQTYENRAEIRFERVNGLRLCSLRPQIGLLHHVLSIHHTPKHTIGDRKEVRPIGFKGFHSVFSLSSTHENRWRHIHYLRPDGCICYFLSNTNSGWTATACSNSSNDEFAVTP